MRRLFEHVSQTSDDAREDDEPVKQAKTQAVHDQKHAAASVPDQSEYRNIQCINCRVGDSFCRWLQLTVSVRPESSIPPTSSSHGRPCRPSGSGTLESVTFS